MSTFVYNSGELEPTQKDSIEMEFGLFFDGTTNNRLHTDARKLVKISQIQPLDVMKDFFAEKRPQKTQPKIPEIGALEETLDPNKILTPQAKKEMIRINRDYDKKRQEELRKIYHKNTEKESSYENDHTNVARMFICCEQDKYGIYIEGVGTENEKKDGGLSPGTGWGVFNGRGIISKVEKGCQLLAKRVKKEAGISINERVKKDKIEKSITLTCDVFGFSRGAAAARHFLYQLTLPAGKEAFSTAYVSSGVPTRTEYVDVPAYGYFGKALEKEGIPQEVINKIRIVCRFVGLYDTVASYLTVGKGFFENKFKPGAEELRLNTLCSPKQVVHFIASDECRANFAISYVRGVPNTIEKILPGVHSDVGGSYDCDGFDADEERCLLRGANESEMYRFKKHLIEEGWYNAPKDLAEEYFGERKPDVLKITIDKSRILKGIRKKVLGTYSYLPLGWMSDYASFYIQNTKIKYSRIAKNYNFQNQDTNEILAKAKKYLNGTTFKALNEALKKRTSQNPLLEDQIFLKEKEATYPNLEWKLVGTKVENGDIPLKEKGVIGIQGIVLIEHKSDQWLKKLRNRYLHQSAHYNKLQAGVFPHEPASGRKRPKF